MKKFRKKSVTIFEKKKSYEIFKQLQYAILEEEVLEGIIGIIARRIVGIMHGRFAGRMPGRFSNDFLDLHIRRRDEPLLLLRIRYGEIGYEG